MNALVAKAIEAIAKLSDVEQEAIARELLTRFNGDKQCKQREDTVRAWLHDLQDYFADIDIPPRQQPPMPKNTVNLDG